MEAQPVTEPTGASRRRGRTALLIAVAAVLGIVGGTATGYAIQADRPPTPLPTLAQAGLAYPSKALPEGEKAEPLSAEEDNQVRTEGDLRELLIDRPAGGREAAVPWLEDGWVSVRAYAHYFGGGGYAFSSALDNGLRRVAGTAWTESGDRQGTVVLAQYRPSVDTHATTALEVLPWGMIARSGSGNPVEGTAKGRYYVYDAGAGEPLRFRAYAAAHRGDVLVKVQLVDSRPIGEKDIRTLIEDQVERL
ncbi:hypothetical protein ACIQVO_26060 [Streptomyces sp. NPDC101062]|uniref:hypothetical protein n=1 Tax=unclassified Streptomyces TaxID=2593676 RepID=UPI00382EB69A